MIKKIAFSTGLVIASIVLIFFGMVTYLSLIRVSDMSTQRRELIRIKEQYEDEYVPIDESIFVNFNLGDQDIRLNEIQMIASHNSYKKLGTKLGKFFVGLGDSFEEARAMEYHNDPLTDQLNLGIRSFELDIRNRNGIFEVTHVPLVDNSTNALNLQLAFEEVFLWSRNNPNHIPIILLLELKNDWMMLDPLMDDFTETELEALDVLIKDSFKTRLITPKNVIGTHLSLRDKIVEDGWPLLKNTLGKILVVLHPGSHTDMYVGMDPTFQTMAMFPAASNRDIYHDYTSFVVHNDPNVESINDLVSRNFIVRTRIDVNLKSVSLRYAKGVASGAQILTTDFHPGHNIKGTTHVAYLNDTYTVVKNRFLMGD